MMVILSALKYRSLKLDRVSINGITVFLIFSQHSTLMVGGVFLCTAMPDFLADAQVSLELFLVAMFYPGNLLCRDELNGKVRKKLCRKWWH
ncbi:hypothetical protein OP853_003490 [Salmonella enterica]|nr:hypothetical protein [Salmonella enterica]